MSIAQTPDGFLWLATEEGLVRFDGTAFVTFDERNSSGLPDRFIRSLATSPDGTLWIGTRSGIARLDHGAFRDFRRQTNFYQDVYDLCADRDGGLWFSSDEGLHNYKDGHQRLFTTADGLPNNGITAMAEAPDGALWIGTRSGLARLKNGGFTVYGRAPPALSVNTLTVGRNGDVWMGTLDGKLARWRAGTITVMWTAGDRADVRPQCLREDRDGNIWIALSHSGLVRLHDTKVDVFKSTSGLPMSNPDWIFEDRDRTLWVGSADAGLSSLRDGKFLNIGTAEGLSSNHVSSILQSRTGAFWIGTEDAGLNRLDGERVTKYSAQQGLREKSIMALLERRDGSIWVGSQDGILSRIAGDRAYTQYRFPLSPPPELPAIVEDSEKDLWLGFAVQNGLAHYSAGQIQNVHLAGRVRGLAMDSAGVLWIASYGEGLVRLSKEGKRVYSEKDGLSSALLTSVFVDAADTVWIGTALAGLNRLKAGKISRITADQGLFDNSVETTLEDDCGYLWMTSKRGLSRTLKSDLNRVAEGSAKLFHSDSFGYADGLRSQEFSLGAQPAAWKARDGRLWFATMAGVASIDPRHLSSDEVAPQVQIESLGVNGKRMRPVKKMQLGPFEGRLEIGFTAPSFISPERVRISYRLAGYETRWVEAGAARTATYTNLPPGNFQFEVRAAARDLRWGSTTVFPFRCRAHFYQTYWFRSLCGIALVLFTYLFYRWRVKYLQTKNAELETRIGQRTADLQVAVEAAKSAQELLWEQAMKDALTGLLNRRAILEVFATESSQCKDPGQELAIILVDLDHFKGINDSCGHLVGDQVLEEVSRILTSNVRHTEKVGRYGGEEILIVLPHCALSNAIRRADELRRAVSEHAIETDAGTLHVTCSIGVAEFQCGSCSRDVIGEADAALYEAKAAGRNCVRSKTMPAIRSNVFMDESCLEYQP